jgi:hypothetical protein
MGLYLVCVGEEDNGLLLAFPDILDQSDVPISRPAPRM